MYVVCSPGLSEIFIHFVSCSLSYFRVRSRFFFFMDLLPIYGIDRIIYIIRQLLRDGTDNRSLRNCLSIHGWPNPIRGSGTFTNGLHHICIHYSSAYSQPISPLTVPAYHMTIQSTKSPTKIHLFTPCKLLQLWKLRTANVSEAEILAALLITLCGPLQTIPRSVQPNACMSGRYPKRDSVLLKITLYKGYRFCWDGCQSAGGFFPHPELL